MVPSPSRTAVKVGPRWLLHDGLVINETKSVLLIRSPENDHTATSDFSSACIVDI